MNPRRFSLNGSVGSRGIRKRWIAIAILVAVFGAALVWGILPRLEATAALRKETRELNIPTVSVIQPKEGEAAQELVLPGNVQAFIDTPIYARTNGYLKRWYADIGTHVKAGQLLAEIDTPEIDDQLQQARADLAIAKANYDLAQTTAERWQGLLKSNSVSRQETDEKLGDMQAKKAALEAAKFNVARLEKLQAFKQIYAPYAGVVTARNTDVGALIDAGAAPAKELFHIASTDRMRVYVNVPQIYSQDARPGVPAELTLAEFPDRRFKGTLVRTSRAIDAASRTLLTEINVDNPTGELLPGAYAQVHFKLKLANRALVVPVNALLFRPEGVMVAVVQQDQRVGLVKVVLGRDFGTEIEVVSGLSGGESIVLNPADSLTAGTQVRVVKSSTASKAGK
ncbi:MAG TPA: efflux RND transporter periplasmic adaptor subunit [Burkholderiales bacterium]|nr:efflux RND transporter periplasmic adaptor subunit [Burkholderiales bacterium]